MTQQTPGSPPDAPRKKKSVWLKPQHVVPVVTSLIAAIALVTGTLITVLVRGTPGVAASTLQPTVTVTATETVAAGPPASTSDPSASSTEASSPSHTKWLTDLDWQRYADYFIHVTPGTAAVGGKKYSHTYTVESDCNGSTQGIFFPTEVGYSHVDVQIGWRDTDSDRQELTAYLAWTDGDASDSVHVPWTEADEVSVGRSGLAKLSGDIPATATAFKLYSLSKQACDLNPVFIDGKYS